MRPQPRSVFRSNAASRLDDVELIAALLERDATKTGAISVERGMRVGGKRRRRGPSIRYRVSARGAKMASAGRGFANGTKRTVLHPRVFAALNATGGFLVDLGIVLSVSAAGVAMLTAAALLLAPPV